MILSKRLRELEKKGRLYQYGHSRTLKNYYISDSYYWFSLKEFFTAEEHEKILKLTKRYRKFCYHVKEVSPKWKTINKIHFADNSVEAEQQDKYGNIRRIMETAPHGDVCF